MTKPRIEITCALAFVDDDHRLTWQEAKIIEKSIAAAVRTALPNHRLRALWVHRDHVATKQPKPRKKKR